MNNAYLAVDIGASSGRLIVGMIKDNKLVLEEVHRFKNSMTYDGDHYHWDIDHLFEEIKTGLKDLDKGNCNYESIGIDTWGVDYVLLDEAGERIAPVYAYRDHRTDDSMETLADLVRPETVYEKTGIQFIQFNTIYQLLEHGRMNDDLKKASMLLLIPDYLHYLLSGERSNEYTNASTSQLLNVATRDWDRELLETVNAPEGLFEKPVEPGTVLGEMKAELKEETGIEAIKVVAPATHDTGSAVVSVPTLDKEYAYISSGTWSLMGIESDVPVTSSKAMEYNFTNEGGVFGTYRVLKNIMGLWLIQEVARLYDGKYSFAEFVELAKEAQPFKSIIDPNDARFLNPENMIEEIQDFCSRTGQEGPRTPGEIARCIFESLALQYKEVLQQLAEISDIPIKRIHIIGGGCQNKLLNQLCADYTGCDVYSGPVEATAIGNLAMQMIASNEVGGLNEARALIRDSFGIEHFVPNVSEEAEAAFERFKSLRKCEVS